MICYFCGTKFDEHEVKVYSVMGQEFEVCELCAEEIVEAKILELIAEEAKKEIRKSWRGV